MKSLLVYFRRRYAAYLACWLSDQHVSNELLLQRMMLCDRYMDHPQLAMDFLNSLNPKPKATLTEIKRDIDKERPL